MQKHSVGLLDTCSLLNLYATRYIREILEDLPLDFALAQRVKQGPLYIRRGGEGENAVEREPVDLSSLISENLLIVVSPECEEEQEAYVAFATQLDDGEAMGCALSMTRGYDLITDEKKTRRILEKGTPDVRFHSTLSLIKWWAELRGLTDPQLKSIFIDICGRTQYVPPGYHTLYQWWERIMNSSIENPKGGYYNG